MAPHALRRTFAARLPASPSGFLSTMRFVMGPPGFERACKSTLLCCCGWTGGGTPRSQTVESDTLAHRLGRHLAPEQRDELLRIGTGYLFLIRGGRGAR